MTVTNRPRPQRAILSIDDVGDVLLIVGTRVSVGHVASADADLGFLGDIDALHATLDLEASFHGGLAWGLTLQDGAAPIEVDGAPMTSGSSRRALHHGDVVRFGQAATFVVRQTDLSSSTLILELRERTEAAGARRVALMAPGDAGRLRLGPRRRRQIPVDAIEHDIALVAPQAPSSDPEGPGGGLDRLRLSCDAGVRQAGSPESGLSVDVPLPVPSMVRIDFGAAPGRQPPFGLALRPL